MHIAKTPREARLKLVAADHYPTLPVSRWTRAGPLAQLVATWIRRERPGEWVMDRPLLETDFEFRGGELPS
jgi:predicted YcjX-like family ATPase